MNSCGSLLHNTNLPVKSVNCLNAMVDMYYLLN